MKNTSNKTYRELVHFHLSKTSKKLACPSCGQKRFVPYVDAETLQPLDETLYGRCDRENSCGYHHIPTGQNGSSDSKKIEIIEEQIRPDKKLIDSILNNAKWDSSPLHSFLRDTLKIPTSHLKDWGVFSDPLKPSQTIFLYQDREGVANLKYFSYLPTGKRDKSQNSFSLKQPNPQNVNEVRYEKKYFMPLFGLHLLPARPNRPVCVVESEKTAVIASYVYKDFHWLACGSANGLTAEKTKLLKECKVIWICDNDQAGRKNSSIRNLRSSGVDFNVLDLFENQPEGFDLADAIISGKKPKIQFTQYLSKHEEQYRLPESCDFRVVAHDIERYGIFQHDHQIFGLRRVATKKSEESTEVDIFYQSEQLTNFSIRPLGLIKGMKTYTNNRRVIEIENIHRFRSTIAVPVKAFTSEQEFRVFVESQGNFQFDATKNTLRKIRSRLYDKMPDFTEFDFLGWQPKYNLWAFANGVLLQNGAFLAINSHGFVETGNGNFYLSGSAAVIDGVEPGENDSRHIYDYTQKITFQKWASTFVSIHGHDQHRNNGPIALAFIFASIYQDFISRKLNFFPHLFAFGPPSSGKDQLGNSLMAAFFKEKKAFHLKHGTKVGFHRQFSDYANSISWFNEYKNNLDSERIEVLKGAFDRTGHSKSVDGSRNKTVSTEVLTSALISGQELPTQDVALFTRTLLLTFSKTKYTPDEVQKLNDFTNLEKNGFAAIILSKLLPLRDLVQQEFENNFLSIANQFSAFEINGDTRLARNYALVLAVYKIIYSKLPDELPFTFDHLFERCKDAFSHQQALIRKTDELSEFWDIVFFLASNKVVNTSFVAESQIKEGMHFEIKQGSELKETCVRIDRACSRRQKGDRVIVSSKDIILYIRLDQIYPFYMKEHRSRGHRKDAIDQSSLKHYAENQAYYIGRTLRKFQLPETTTARCVAFNLSQMYEMGMAVEQLYPKFLDKENE